MTRTRKSLIGGALVVAGLITLGPLGAAPTTTHAATPATQGIGGTLQPGFATDGSTPLQLAVPTGGGASKIVSVQVSSSTTVVRRYNGISSLSELSPGDSIGVRGTMSGTDTIIANTVKDFSIQRAFTHNLGVITAASSGPNGTTTLKVRVLHDSIYKGQNPFAVGNTISMNVPSTLKVILADGTVSTFGSLGSTSSSTGSAPTSFLDSVNNNPVGITIATLGVYNRQTLGFQSVWRMRVVTATPGSTTVISGVLQPGFTVSSAATSTLTLQTRNRGTVTVNVDSNALIVRRYNGISSLAELSPNDRLTVVGKYLGNSTYSATTIKDFTIQRAFTFMIGEISGVSGNTLTVTVQANNRHHARDPFKIGQSITVNATGATVTLANGTTGAISALTPNTRIGVVGVYNRQAHSFTSAFRIRVLNS